MGETSVQAGCSQGKSALLIRRTLARIENGQPVFTTPKNAKSLRRIDLNDRTVEVLKVHRARQIEESKTFAGLWQDYDLMFTTTIGTPVSRHNLDNRSFKPLLWRAGLRTIRFHDLRHGCATFLMRSGEHVREVQELLGHSTSKTTLDTYSHVAPGGGKRLADAIDDALRNS